MANGVCDKYKGGRVRPENRFITAYDEWGAPAGVVQQTVRGMCANCGGLKKLHFL